MNARNLVVAILLATLPALVEAQTSTTPPPPQKPAATKPATTTPAKKKKKKKATAPAAAPAAPAAAPLPAPSTAPSTAPPAEVTAPAAAPVAKAKAGPPPLPAPTGPIGSVALVTGSVTATSAMNTRSLSRGDAISEGETVVVGPNSYASLKFNDGGRVLLRPNTEFAVEQLRSREPLPVETHTDAGAVAVTNVEGAAVFRLVRGGLRAISGLIGHGQQQDYRVQTPAATIGIRGTDYEVQTCSDDCPSQALALAGPTEVASNTLAGLQLAQAGGGGSGGIIVATNEGAIVLKSAQGETVLDAGKVALSLSSGQTVMLPKVPDNLLINSTPSPKDCE